MTFDGEGQVISGISVTNAISILPGTSRQNRLTLCERVRCSERWCFAGQASGD